MMNRCPKALSLALLILMLASPTAAQTSITTPATLAEALNQLTLAAGTGQLGDFVRQSTVIEIATMPLGSSSRGAVTALDPTTGLEVKTMGTLGPSFGERALTAGAGKASVSVNMVIATYDKLNDLKLERMQLTSTQAPVPQLQQTGVMSLVMSSTTTVINGVIGASEKFDVGAMIPIVKVKVDGIAWTENMVVRQQADGQVGPDILRRTAAKGESTGLGDIAVLGKFRLAKFGAAPPPGAPIQPDPGGLALMGTVRLPTGSRDDLRGLGITRAMLSLIASAGKGRLKPHGSGGFEWWEKAIDMTSPIDPTVRLRHQVQWTGGIEIEAAPKLTIGIDVLGRHILGAGGIDSNRVTSAERPLTPAGITSLDYVRATEAKISKISIVPSLKWNIKGKALLSLSGIASVMDNSLHDMFTPVVGLDWTF
jgi:hypothetical protein